MGTQGRGGNTPGWDAYLSQGTILKYWNNGMQKTYLLYQTMLSINVTEIYVTFQPVVVSAMLDTKPYFA